MPCIEVIIMNEMDRVPETHGCIVPEDVKTLCELLRLVESSADAFDAEDDPREWMVSFFNSGEHNGELLLSRISKLATECLFSKENECLWFNISEVIYNGYDVDCADSDMLVGKWRVGAIYTKRGVIYYNAPN